MEEDEHKNQQVVTLGVCSELLPSISAILKKSKYASHMVSCLDFLRVVVKRWFVELRQMSKEKPKDGLSLNLPAVYFGIVGLQKQVKQLSTRDGLLGRKAKVVADLFDQI